MTNTIVDKKKIAVYLTTVDNPFNPSTQWDEWRRFDEDSGYFTSELLARASNTSIDLTDEEYLSEVEQIIDTFCRLNPLGIYKKLIIYSE